MCVGPLSAGARRAPAPPPPTHTHLDRPPAPQDRFKDHVLGRVKVEVGDVAAAGRLRRGYPLQGALMGHLELSMQWIPADLAM
jgi:hypothetical protein